MSWASSSKSKTTDSSSSGKEPENLADHAIAQARKRVLFLWKTIWGALYKGHPKASFYRIDELQALCLAAGGAYFEGAKKKSFLGPLDTALTYNAGQTLSNFKMEKDTSLELYSRLIEILEAYSKEIKSVAKIEELLREGQVPLREPTEQDWNKVWEEIAPLVLSTGRKLTLYHTRLYLLEMEIEKEALGQKSADDFSWTWIRDLVYPRTSSKKLAISSTMSMSE